MPRPGLRILCTSQVALGIDGEVVLELGPLSLADGVELFTRHASAQRLRSSPARAGEDSVVDLCRSLDGLPLAIELAAARTRTLSVEEISRRLDDRFRVLSDPTSRRPERRRSLKSTIAWSYDLLFPDDKRGLWALATFAGGAPLPAVESVLEALDVPAAAAIDVVARLASRSLVMVDEPGQAACVRVEPAPRAVAPTRYRLLDSIRVFALEEMAEAGLTERARAAHAEWCARCRRLVHGRSAQRSAGRAPRSRPDRARQHRRCSGWSAAHDPQLTLSIANGFGWAWVVLGDSRGAQRILMALDVERRRAPARQRCRRPAARGVDRGVDRRSRPSPPAHRRGDGAGRRDHDAELLARCYYYLAYVVSHQGEFRTAWELTERSRAIYDTLDRPWDQAANALFAARAAISAGEERRGIEAVDQVRRWLSEVDDPWLHVRGEAIQGELARLQHRFDDAVLHIERAARTSGQLGFRQTEAFQVLSLGRAQCQARDYDRGLATLDVAMEKAQATGDVRLAALARVHLGRVLRAVGDVPRARAELEAAARWHRDAGGGEQAALGQCLLAAMDAVGRRTGRPRSPPTCSSTGHGRGTTQPSRSWPSTRWPVWPSMSGEVGDARDLREAADRRFGAASHLITDVDRTDAHWVSQIV